MQYRLMITCRNDCEILADHHEVAAAIALSQDDWKTAAEHQELARTYTDAYLAWSDALWALTGLPPR